VIIALIASILAGGSSIRIGFGIDKCFYSTHSKPLILHIVERLRNSRLFEEVYVFVSYRNAQHAWELGLNTAIDVIECGPLSAIYQLIKMFKEVFVVACDMPFISINNIERLLLQCSEDAVACIPRWSSTKFLEPLYAIYRRDVADLFEKCFALGELSIAKCIAGLNRVRFVNVESTFIEPHKEFFNVNTFEELKLVGDTHPWLVR
jgi:molybdopterin-guanine dinucleotide biosynthesis protein A